VSFLHGLLIHLQQVAINYLSNQRATYGHSDCSHAASYVFDVRRFRNYYVCTIRKLALRGLSQTLGLYKIDIRNSDA